MAAFLPGCQNAHGEDLILAWPLGRIDYEHFHWSLARFQLEAQIRQGGEDGWAHRSQVNRPERI